MADAEDPSEVSMADHFNQVLNNRPPRRIPYLPLPETFFIGTANSPDDTQLFVTITFETPMGEDMHFLPADRAMNLAKMIQKHARDVMAFESTTAKLVDKDGKKLV